MKSCKRLRWGSWGPVLLLLLPAAMFLFPQTVISGAAKGLLLWYRTVLPVLLPFLILSQILLESGLVRLLGTLLSPFLRPVFAIPEEAAFAVFGGFLCGYPVGAKLSFGLRDTGVITDAEAQYLLSFCNNASPMFVVSYLFLQKLRRPDLALPSLGILWGSTVLCSFLFRKRREEADRQKRNPRQGEQGIHMTFQILDDAIGGGCETMIHIGGYIVTFSVLMALLERLPAGGAYTGALWKLLFLPSLEITGGVELLTEAAVPFGVRYVLIMALTAFGGFCAAFQTRCVAGRDVFSMARYIKEKLITAVVTSLFAYLWIKLYYR